MGNVTKGLKNACENGTTKSTTWSTFSPVCIAMGPIRFYHKQIFWDGENYLPRRFLVPKKSWRRIFFNISFQQSAVLRSIELGGRGEKFLPHLPPPPSPSQKLRFLMLPPGEASRKKVRQIIKKCIGRRRRNFPFLRERERERISFFPGKLSEDTGGRKN